MNINTSALKTLFSSSVVEIKFKRRRFKPGWSGSRRMLCTNNWNLLNSMTGKVALNFKAPTHPPPFNVDAYNLVTVWDLLWQDYRNVSVETHDVIAALPVTTEEEINKFWIYFNEVLQDMNSSTKIAIMNS